MNNLLYEAAIYYAHTCRVRPETYVLLLGEEPKDADQKKLYFEKQKALFRKIVFVSSKCNY